ncbi:transcriptional regulator, TetR family [Corynebacterium lipophiloflavum DSM 44291]|uniref:Transcriptional regulator, TetR family n=1 Tax=Corynebacterium lipophiloflavum (strain ATCC 700352 / DSM 44291 / CCUG 37336 / JCM 10383 / DMMZ 1944) TaxID=525263 RepID=C0XPX2_CORLD|nr:transcriptional regulator, TetR family [Corynebacterium lipophiloflavum DSM 44291]
MRERKRLATLYRIYDESLALVEQHGADAVTVEDICAAADISRRTFFNYVASKDDAILGAFPFELDSEALATIESTPSDNIIELIVSQLKENAEHLDRGLLERRRVMVADNPSLAHATHKRRVNVLTALARAVEKHFERFPDDRKLHDLPVHVEVHAVIEVFRSALSLFLSNPRFPADTDSAVDGVRRAARIYTTYYKELAW